MNKGLNLRGHPIKDMSYTFCEYYNYILVSLFEKLNFVIGLFCLTLINGNVLIIQDV